MEETSELVRASNEDDDDDEAESSIDVDTRVAESESVVKPLDGSVVVKVDIKLAEVVVGTGELGLSLEDEESIEEEVGEGSPSEPSALELNSDERGPSVEDARLKLELAEGVKEVDEIDALAGGVSEEPNVEKSWPDNVLDRRSVE